VGDLVDDLAGLGCGVATPDRGGACSLTMKLCWKDVTGPAGDEDGPLTNLTAVLAGGDRTRGAPGPAGT